MILPEFNELSYWSQLVRVLNPLGFRVTITPPTNLLGRRIAKGLCLVDGRRPESPRALWCARCIAKACCNRSHMCVHKEAA